MNTTPNTVNEPLWKKYDASEYFSKIQIPQNWNSLEEFVDWYMLEARMPWMIPFNAEVMESDDAVAICLFRKGNYQVELYLEYPENYVRRHAHPRMEVIIVDLGGGCFSAPDGNGMSTKWGNAKQKLLAGEEHGGDIAHSLAKGFIFLAFQKWEIQEEMSSASVQWKGEIQGPHQANLIRSRKPNSIILKDFADVTADTSLNK